MWDERFAEPGYAYGTEPNQFLASVSGDIPIGQVLCLAEGEGRNAVFLAGLGHDVTAVDTSTIGLAKAGALAARHGAVITTVERDLEHYTIGEGRWQAIVSIFCHLPPALRAGLHSRCVRGLAPDGVLVLVGFTPRQLEHGTGGPRDVVLLMEPEEILCELAGLEPIISREVQRPLIEGRYHTGTSAVFELFAVKPARTPSGTASP